MRVAQHLRVQKVDVMVRMVPSDTKTAASNYSESERGDMRNSEDVFGRALLDWARGGRTPEVLERDDGFTQLGAGPEVYLSEFSGWPAAERKSVRYLRGRVIDVGCGAGRVALDLQHRGIEVVGLDSSPLAVRAAKIRGVKEVWCLPVEELASRIGSFDSIVLFGNNFGIFETANHARQVLTDLAKSSKPGARIFAESHERVLWRRSRS